MPDNNRSFDGEIKSFDGCYYVGEVDSYGQRHGYGFTVNIRGN